jgi:hypothetical protein
MNWIYTNILHDPRKVLGISVLEYCVLDYVYKTQTHPEYGVNGWTKTGCHKIADFLGVSSGTVKGIFDRMDNAGLLERMGNDLKRATAKFYSIAYEQDVQKLNGGCSETERGGVQKLNGKRSETEQYINKETKVLNKIEKKVVENSFSTVTLIDEVDETSVEIHHVPDYFDTEQKNPTPQVAPPPRPKKQRAKSANPAPTRAMFQYYEQKYAELNKGELPIWMDKYGRPLKDLFNILTARFAQKGIIQLDPMQPWKDFVDMWTQYLVEHPKEQWHRNNFNPMTMYSQFNGIMAMMNAQPVKVQSDRMDKWEKWGRENGVM